MVDFGKLVVILAAIASSTALLALGVIDDAAGVGIITGALGYVTGNGVLARKGEPPSPAIGRLPAPADEGAVRVYPEPPAGGWNDRPGQRGWPG